MLNKLQLMTYLRVTHSLSAEAVDYVRNSIRKPASRPVGVHAKTNTKSQVMSKKTLLTYETESRGPERAFFSLCEDDPDVLEYAAQVEPILVVRTTKKGQKRRGYYTPDALVLHATHGVKVVEVKTRDEVEQKCEKNPSDWKAEDGKITYVPAVDAFKEIGLKYEVFVYDSSDNVFYANLDLRLQSRNQLDVDPATQAKILRAFDKSYYYTLGVLKDVLDLDSVVPVIQLVDRKKLAAAEKSYLLAEPYSCIVVRSCELLENAIAEFRSQQVQRETFQHMIGIDLVPRETDAKNALDRIDRLDESSRQGRRLRALVNDGQKLGLSTFQSLLTNYRKSGNRTPRLPSQVQNYLRNYFDTEYAKYPVSLRRHYSHYKSRALRSHPNLAPVSRRVFNNVFKTLSPSFIAKLKGGNRLENQASAPSDVLKRLVRAMQPFQLAAIDHCLAKIWIVTLSANGKIYIARPWITCMVDIATNYVLATSYSLKAPSKHSIAKVIRECVRVHGRAPSELITDRGAEFKSVYYSSLLAHYEITLSLRPAGHSRYGSEVESIFGEFQKQWLIDLPGNMVDRKNLRSLDGSHHPKKMAVLRLRDFIEVFSQFISWRNNKIRGKASVSSSEAFSNPSLGRLIYGVEINNDETFQLVTSIDSSKYMLEPARGLHIDGIWYWSTEFLKYGGQRKSLEVRIDPENPYTVYALVEGRWVAALASKNSTFLMKNGPSQRTEQMLVREAIAERKQAFDDADLEATKIIMSMQDSAQAGELSFAQIESNERDVGVKEEDKNSIFEAFKTTSVRKSDLKFFQS